MTNTTANARRESNETNATDSASRRYEYEPDSDGEACSCGVSCPKVPQGQWGKHCPLGMPWECFRQMQLPFAEPKERRANKQSPLCSNRGVTTHQQSAKNSSRSEL
jgi:hypothetical protein